MPVSRACLRLCGVKPFRARTFVALLAGTVCAASIVSRAGSWQVFSNATLISNPYNDGDSFHVKVGRKEYVFRLYFVDTPETDKSVPGRVEEQAKYWGIEPDDALQWAKRATRFSRKALKDPFTVYTKMEDARGRGHLPRHFAMVRVGERYLSEALVAEGLARIYGAHTDLPDERPWRKYVADLHVLEHEAQRTERGAWGDAEAARPSAPSTGQIERSVAVYSDDDDPHLLGILNRGAHVEIEDGPSAVWVRVRFDAGEERRSGLCRRCELHLGDPE